MDSKNKPAETVDLDAILEWTQSLRALGASVALMGEQEKSGLYGEDLMSLGLMISDLANRLNKIVGERWKLLHMACNYKQLWAAQYYRNLYNELISGLYGLSPAQEVVMKAIHELENHLRETKAIHANFQALRKQNVAFTGQQPLPVEEKPDPSPAPAIGQARHSTPTPTLHGATA